MKKSIVILSGAAVVAGFSLLTAFGGTVTKAQQLAEVASKVTTEISALRDMKAKECEESIAAEANAKAQTMLAAPAPAQIAPVMPGKGPAKPTKKPTKGGNGKPSVDPMPQPAPPAKKPETEAGKASGRIGGEAPVVKEVEKAKSRVSGEAPAVKEAEKAKGRIKGGGN
jgi:hypothetical protein